MNPSDTSVDIAYTFGRPVESYVSPRDHARLTILKSRLHARIPNGLPYMVEFELAVPADQCEPLNG